MLRSLPFHAGVVLLLAGLLFAGCVSKAKANVQAREAFLAGQQQAMARMQQVQTQGPQVTLVGPVKNTSVPWNADLTVAKAIVAAGYFGKDPRAIVILRQGKAYTIDPQELLRGDDVPLESGDIVQISE